jgi:hypothetical protein
MRFTRITAALFVAAVLAAPAAYAQPPDMHASTAVAAAQAREKQDLRSPDARDAAIHLHRSGVVVGQTAVPMNPQPAKAVAPAASDSGIDWATIGIGVLCSLIAVAAFALILNRRPQRLRVTN